MMLADTKCKYCNGHGIWIELGDEDMTTHECLTCHGTGLAVDPDNDPADVFSVAGEDGDDEF